MRNSAMFAFLWLLTLSACSNQSASVQGAFVQECAANGNAQSICECAFDFASDVFSDEQLQFYRAVVFNNERDIAKYKAQLGLMKAARLITRVGMVAGDIERTCGRLRYARGVQQPTNPTIERLEHIKLNVHLPAGLETSRREVLRISPRRGTLSLLEAVGLELKKLALSSSISIADKCFFGALSAVQSGGQAQFVKTNLRDLAVEIAQAGFGAATTGTQWGDTLLRVGTEVAGEYFRDGDVPRAFAISVTEETVGYYLSSLVSKHKGAYSGARDTVVRKLVGREVEELLEDEGVISESFDGSNSTDLQQHGGILPLARVRVRWLYSPKTHFLSAYFSSNCDNDQSGLYLIRFQMEKRSDLGPFGNVIDTESIEKKALF